MVTNRPPTGTGKRKGRSSVTLLNSECHADDATVSFLGSLCPFHVRKSKVFNNHCSLEGKRQKVVMVNENP